MNLSKQVRFQMIADSRFTKDILKEIENLHKKVLSVLGDKNKFDISFSDKRYLTFENGKTQQYRITYFVRINKELVKWNDLYGLVNSVKAVPYQMV